MSRAEAPAQEGMLSTDDLHRLALNEQLNLDVAKEALVQTEKRLVDCHEVRKTTEAKAQTLFGTFVTASLALLSGGGALLRDPAYARLAWVFFAAGVALGLGALLLGIVQRGAVYGNLGTRPHVWLQTGTIDGGDQELPLALAGIVHDHEKRIRDSDRSNKRKRLWLNRGMAAGLTAAAILTTGVPAVWLFLS